MFIFKDCLLLPAPLQSYRILQDQPQHFWVPAATGSSENDPNQGFWLRNGGTIAIQWPQDKEQPVQDKWPISVFPEGELP